MHRKRSDSSNAGNVPEAQGENRGAIPRIMIAAPRGRSGKTVLTLGLLRALSRRGLHVQPFKKGPDYIDPGWHAVAAGVGSRNLDLFFMDEEQVRQVAVQAAAGADVAVIEAAMGLYDGLDVEGSSSSAQIAKATGTPIILVVDVTRVTRTAAALVMGCQAFDPDVRIAGVILNKVRGQRQRALVTEAIQRYCNVPVVGSIPSSERMGVPDRHLGLVTTAEFAQQDQAMDGMAAVVEEWVDVDAVLGIARTAPPLFASCLHAASGQAVLDAPFGRPTIAVMRDRAFTFYYPENLAALEQAGANLVFVDSMEDAALPADCDGLYVGGGFPEEFAASLQANRGMRVSIQERVRQGMPVFAECGGLMYLGRSLTYQGETYDMVGALPLDTVMTDKQVAHGYACGTVDSGCCWLPVGTRLVGHEHHHSLVRNLGDNVQFACQLDRGHGIDQGRECLCCNQVIAGYLHVNAIATPAWAPSFAAAAAQYRSNVRAVGKATGE